MSLSLASKLKILFIPVGLLIYIWVAHHNSVKDNIASNAAIAIGIIPVVLTLIVVFTKTIPSSLFFLRILAMVVLAVMIYLIWDLLKHNVYYLYLIDHGGSNLALATLFGSTLFGKQKSFITRLALFAHDNKISPAVYSYTAKATLAWTLFFIFNATISIGLFVFAPIGIWSSYANLLSMPLFFGMFVLDYIGRRLVLSPEDRPSIATVLSTTYKNMR